MKAVDIIATKANITEAVNSLGGVAETAKIMGLTRQAVTKWMRTNNDYLPTIDNLFILATLSCRRLDEVIVVRREP